MARSIPELSPEEFRARLEASEKQNAALKNAVLKLRASSSEVQKLFAEQQTQHEEDQEALKQARLREDELLRRCSTAEKLLAESKEACQQTEAVAQELKSREQSGNALIPADIEAKLHKLLAGSQTLGQEKSLEGQQDPNGSLISVLKWLLNLPEPQHIPPEVGDQALSSHKRRRTDLSDKELPLSKVDSQPERLTIDVASEWIDRLMSAPRTKAGVYEVGEGIHRAILEDRSFTPETLATCIMISLEECCYESWQYDQERVHDALDGAVDSADSLLLALEGLDCIEEQTFTAFWMLENKRANAAYTRLLALVSVLKDDVIFQKGRKSGTQGVGQRVWETLLEVLQTELIIKHYDRRREHLYIDCGLAVAIIALYRMNQDIEAARMLMMNIMLPAGEKSLPDVLAIFTAILCTWPHILSVPSNLSCKALQTLLRCQCLKSLARHAVDEDEITQAGSLHGEPSFAGSIGTKLAAKCLMRLGEAHYNWPALDLDLDVPDPQKHCLEAIQNHLKSLEAVEWSNPEEAETVMLFTVVSAFQGSKWLSEQVEAELAKSNMGRQTGALEQIRSQVNKMQLLSGNK